jgi:hypothetical protein
MRFGCTVVSRLASRVSRLASRVVSRRRRLASTITPNVHRRCLVMDERAPLVRADAPERPREIDVEASARPITRDASRASTSRRRFASTIVGALACLLALAFASAPRDAPAHARGDVAFALSRSARALARAPALALAAVTGADFRPRLDLADVDVDAVVREGRLLSEREFADDAGGAGLGGVRANASCAVRFKDANMRLCRCRPDDGRLNAGDLVGPRMAMATAQHYFYGCVADALPVEATTCFGAEPHACLLTVGSVLEKAKKGDHVWGTGAWHRRSMMDAWKHAGAIIHGVRGPNTQSALRGTYKNSDGSGSVNAYAIGDPGFLVSFTNPELGRGVERRGRCFVRHHYDVITVTPPGVVDIETNQHWETFVRQIASCERVFSSSLHGLIFAESFGVPVRWYQPSEGIVPRAEGHWKYLDWIGVTPRAKKWHVPASNITDIFDDDAYPPPFSLGEKRRLARRLAARFPYHLFETYNVPSPST